MEWSTPGETAVWSGVGAGSRGRRETHRRLCAGPGEGSPHARPGGGLDLPSAASRVCGGGGGGACLPPSLGRRAPGLWPSVRRQRGIVVALGIPRRAPPRRQPVTLPRPAFPSASQEPSLAAWSGVRGVMPRTSYAFAALWRPETQRLRAQAPGRKVRVQTPALPGEAASRRRCARLPAGRRPASALRAGSAGPISTSGVDSALPGPRARRAAGPASPPQTGHGRGQRRVWGIRAGTSPMAGLTGGGDPLSPGKGKPAWKPPPRSCAQETPGLSSRIGRLSTGVKILSKEPASLPPCDLELVT